MAWDTGSLGTGDCVTVGHSQALSESQCPRLCKQGALDRCGLEDVLCPWLWQHRGTSWICVVFASPASVPTLSNNSISLFLWGTIPSPSLLMCLGHVSRDWPTRMPEVNSGMGASPEPSNADLPWDFGLSSGFAEPIGAAMATSGSMKRKHARV